MAPIMPTDINTAPSKLVAGCAARCATCNYPIERCPNIVCPECGNCPFGCNPTGNGIAASFFSCVRVSLALGLLIGRVLRPLSDGIWPDPTYYRDLVTLGGAIGVVLLSIAVVLETAHAIFSRRNARMRHSCLRVYVSWSALVLSGLVVWQVPS